MTESEPGPVRQTDYRMSLAAERTYLAYLRTGLALIAAGVAVAAALPDAGAAALRRATGLVLIVLGGCVFAAARPRLRAVQSAMERGAPLPGSRTTQWLGLALVLVAIAGAVIALVA